MNAEATTTATLSGTGEMKAGSTDPTRTSGLRIHGSANAGTSPAKMTTAPLSTSARTTAGAHMTTMAKAGVTAGRSGILVKAVAVGGVGVAGLAAAAHAGAVPGLSVALSNVPVWTHAHAVLSLLSQKLRVVGQGALHLGL